MKSNTFLVDKKPYLLPLSTNNCKYKLDIVETLFPQCENVLTETKKAVCNLYQYPSLHDITELTTLVQQYNKCDKKIIFTNGSDNALKLIIDTFFTPESLVTVIIPTYPHFVQMASTSLSFLNFVKCENEIDILNQLDKFENSDVIYLCSPNLPFGYIATDSIKKLLEINKETIVIVDEAYFEYGNNFTAIDLLKTYSNLIVTRTFSKFFGLAALRIGYLQCNSLLYDKLIIMHNGKNITKIASVAATTALKNIEYYKNQLKDFEISKQYLLNTLPTCITKQSLIYDYNVEYGNFFLLYSTDVKKVCREFEKLSGISIRNKHDEIKNAIRISIAPKNIMTIVCKVIDYLNNYPNSFFALDLDATIRPNAKLTSQVTNKTKNFLKTRDCVIITNNTVHTENEIRTQLDIIDNTNIKIVRPCIPENCFVIDQHTKKNLPDINKLPDYKGICIMNSVLDVGSDVWAIVSKLLKRNLFVYVVEENSKTSINMSSETTLNGDTFIPDTGFFLQHFKINSYTIIGKPNIYINFLNKKVIMIGDSDSDELFAKKNHCQFIKINQDCLETIITEKNTTINSIDIL